MNTTVIASEAKQSIGFLLSNELAITIEMDVTHEVPGPLAGTYMVGLS